MVWKNQEIVLRASALCFRHVQFRQWYIKKEKRKKKEHEWYLFFCCIKICFPNCHPQQIRRSLASWSDELKTLSFKNNKCWTIFFYAFRVRLPSLCTHKEYKLKRQEIEEKRKKETRRKKKKKQGLSIKIVSLVIDWKNSQVTLLWQSHDRATFWSILFFFYLH